MNMKFSQRKWCSKIVLVVAVSLSVLLKNVQCQSQQSPGPNVSNNEISGSESESGATAGKTSSFSNSSPIIAAVPINNGHYREYGSSYYYPHAAQKPIVWNRDSYADAASDFGYNPALHPTSHGSSHSYVPNNEYGVAEGHEDEEGEGGGALGGLGGLGGLAGLAGVLGIKGIKGLGLLGILKAGLPLFVLLLPALLLLPLVFLFLPVPVITVPSNPTGRTINGGFRFGDMSAKMSQLARSVLESEKCVERMSCELSRVSRGTFLDKTLKRVFSKFETHFPKSLQRVARAYMDQDQSSYCNKKYACYLVDNNKISKSS